MMTSQRKLICLKRFARKGITLTESLIAMGVASIGMFGVFVLIPFCARQAQLGEDYDGAGQVAKASVDHFEISGMNNPSRWVWNDDSGPPPMTVDIVNATDVTDGNGGTTPDGVPDWKQDQYCIDPLGLTAFGASNRFPDIAMPSARKMQRIYLRGITEAMSDFHFRNRDDIKFRIPDDKAELPTMNFIPADANAGTAILTASDGDMSWMAMIEPQPGHEANDLWRLYVVVFKERKQPSVESIAKRYNVTFVDQGIGGGDVTLVGTPPPATATVDERQRFRLHRNSWVMLQVQSTSNSRFAWYRVISADAEEFDETAPPATVNTHLTLQGPDWPLAGAPAAPVPATAIFLPDVIMVYEKTIRLETSSKWSFD